MVAHYRPPEPTTGTHFAILFHASASEENLCSEASFCLGRTSLPRDPLLAGGELVRSPEEDFGRQVPAQFAAEGALNGDGLKWEFIPPGRHIATASLASDDEALPTSAHLEHASMIGK